MPNNGSTWSPGPPPRPLGTPGLKTTPIPSITNAPPVPEDGFISTNISIGLSSSVLDWRIMNKFGHLAADGSNGIFNPGTLTYGSPNPPNLEGTIAATLRGGSTGNQFFQSSRHLTVANRTYRAVVAAGLRSSGPDVFGNGRIELLSGHILLAFQGISATDLTPGEFTDVEISGLATPVNDNEELNVRVIKLDGGPETYPDFDNVRLTEIIPSPFEDWALTNGVVSPEGDPDNDSLVNLLEFTPGHDPNQSGHPTTPFTNVAGALRITRRIAGPAGLAYRLETSGTLANGSWTEVTYLTTTLISSDGIFETVDLTTTGGWSPDEQNFYRLCVELLP